MQSVSIRSQNSQHHDHIYMISVEGAVLNVKKHTGLAAQSHACLPAIISASAIFSTVAPSPGGYFVTVVHLETPGPKCFNVRSYIEDIFSHFHTNTSLLLV